MSNINIQIQAGFAGGDQSAVDIVVVPPPTPPAPPVTINPISFLQDIDNNGTIELAEATGTVTFRCIVPSNVDISPTTTDSVLLVLPVYGALPNYPLSALGPYIANGVLSIPIPFVSGVFAVSITFTAGGVVQPTLSNSVIVEGRYVPVISFPQDVNADGTLSLTEWALPVVVRATVDSTLLGIPLTLNDAGGGAAQVITVTQSHITAGYVQFTLSDLVQGTTYNIDGQYTSADGATHAFGKALRSDPLPLVAPVVTLPQDTDGNKAITLTEYVAGGVGGVQIKVTIPPGIGAGCLFDFKWPVGAGAGVWSSSSGPTRQYSPGAYITVTASEAAQGYILMQNPSLLAGIGNGYGSVEQMTFSFSTQDSPPRVTPLTTLDFTLPDPNGFTFTASFPADVNHDGILELLELSSSNAIRIVLPNIAVIGDNVYVTGYIGTDTTGAGLWSGATGSDTTGAQHQLTATLASADIANGYIDFPLTRYFAPAGTYTGNYILPGSSYTFAVLYSSVLVGNNTTLQTPAQLTVAVQGFPAVTVKCVSGTTKAFSDYPTGAADAAQIIAGIQYIDSTSLASPVMLQCTVTPAMLGLGWIITDPAAMLYNAGNGTPSIPLNQLGELVKTGWTIPAPDGTGLLPQVSGVVTSTDVTNGYISIPYTATGNFDPTHAFLQTINVDFYSAGWTTARTVPGGGELGSTTYGCTFLVAPSPLLAPTLYLPPVNAIVGDVVTAGLPVQEFSSTGKVALAMQSASQTPVGLYPFQGSIAATISGGSTYTGGDYTQTQSTWPMVPAATPGVGVNLSVTASTPVRLLNSTQVLETLTSPPDVFTMIPVIIPNAEGLQIVDVTQSNFILVSHTGGSNTLAAATTADTFQFELWPVTGYTLTAGDAWNMVIYTDNADRTAPLYTAVSGTVTATDVSNGYVSTNRMVAAGTSIFNHSGGFSRSGVPLVSMSTSTYVQL
jgi:hypothetical protein